MQENLFEIKVKNDGTTNESRWLINYHGNEKLVEIPEGITGIACNAFSDCGNVEEIVVPKDVKSISKKAFCGCSGLKRIRFLTEDSIGFSEEVFQGIPSELEIIYAGSSDNWKRSIKPHTVTSHSYDNGWGGSAPGLYTYETTYYPMKHALQENFICHVKCLADGVELLVNGEWRSGGIREVSTPYDR